ncbi:MAG: HAD family hydrolase [Candidatus Omnitrophica bacterium]|nr:HAD family hydrolase [Candidatus Omnitrophota bacterium]
MKAIFLDRDGVINRYPGDRKYVTHWKYFRFLPRVKKAIALLSKNDYRLFVISNQAGVGKKVFSKKALEEITQNMLREIRQAGGDIEGVYYCTHRKQVHCSCRKPKTGLIKLVVKKYPVSLKKTFFIGDTIRDIHTAKAAGCKSILVFSGKEKKRNQKCWEIQPDFMRKDLFLAARLILEKK